ncbi:MAG TPA: hypothetical protein VGU02_15760 [Gaiellaceae bacterium]|nr:hypothetical protein [Gaiellaceae bacterium]
MNRNRTVLVVALLAIASLTLTAAAVAGGGKKHKQAAKHHRVVVKRRVQQRRKTFAPTVIVKAAEVSAVELDPLTQQFMQVTFDRGRVTADSSSSITLQQKQDAAVWRTETFSVPATAVVTLNGRPTTLAQIPTGTSARVESSGAPGGSQTVVRVNAFSHGEAPLPAAS